MAKRNSRPRNFVEWWHSLPWNGLFWLSVFALFAGAALFAILAHLTSGDIGRVVEEGNAEVVDGDEVTVVLVLNGDEVLIEKDGRVARLRMLAIRSFDPVVNEREITSYGRASVHFLMDRILNQKVRVTFDKPIKDSHGRYLAYLHLGGVDVNRLMIESGISMVYTEFATAREGTYLTAENLARREGLGIWSGEKTVPRIVGLRKKWANGRRARGQTLPADPLLWEAP